MSDDGTPRGLYLCPTRRCPLLGWLATGVLDRMRRHGGRVGVFRPIVTSAEGEDRLLEDLLVRAGDPAAPPHWGASADELVQQPEEAMGRVLDRYAACAAGHDAMLVLGSAYDSALAPVEFGWNTRVAADLDVPLTLVVPGGSRAARASTTARVALGEAARNSARVGGVIVVVRDSRQARGAEEPSCPSVRTFVVEAPADDERHAPLAGPGARLLSGSRDGADPGEPVFAEGPLTDVLALLRPGTTLVFPAARPDIPIGVVVANRTGRFPLPALAIAAGPERLGEQVRRMWEELAGGIPLLGTGLSLTQLRARRAELSAPRAGHRTSGVRGVDVEALLGTRRPAGDGAVTPLLFQHRLLQRARGADRHIVLAEGEEERIIRAAHRLLDQGICRITLLGDPGRIARRASSMSLDVSAARIIEPVASDLVEDFAARYADVRASKGVSPEQARETVTRPNYFGTMMVLTGLADGMVCGAVHTTADTIRPPLEVIRTRPGVSVVSSVFLICLADRVLVFGDCAVNPSPSAEQVADIAISSARTATRFGIAPRVAMLSYSTGDSASGPSVETTAEATRLVHEKAPELTVDGPLQYDAAVDPVVARTKMPDSPVAGRANVLIFPDLAAGNITYKAVQRSAGALAIGPVLQGLNKPVNDLSRGALVPDIVNTVAVTAVQAGAD